MYRFFTLPHSYNKKHMKSDCHFIRKLNQRTIQIETKSTQYLHLTITSPLVNVLFLHTVSLYYKESVASEATTAIHLIFCANLCFVITVTTTTTTTTAATSTTTIVNNNYVSAIINVDNTTASSSKIYLTTCCT
jgi:hypothetical protein